MFSEGGKHQNYYYFLSLLFVILVSPKRCDWDKSWRDIKTELCHFKYNQLSLKCAEIFIGPSTHSFRHWRSPIKETELMSEIPRTNLLKDTGGSYAWIQELRASAARHKRGVGVWIATEAVAGIFNDWPRWGKEEVHCVQIRSVLAGCSHSPAHGTAHWGSALMYSCSRSRWRQKRRG